VLLAPLALKALRVYQLLEVQGLRGLQAIQALRGSKDQQVHRERWVLVRQALTEILVLLAPPAVKVVEGALLVRQVLLASQVVVVELQAPLDHKGSLVLRVLRGFKEWQVRQGLRVQQDQQELKVRRVQREHKVQQVRRERRV
jgi:hypothetical protein